MSCRKWSFCLCSWKICHTRRQVSCLKTFIWSWSCGLNWIKRYPCDSWNKWKCTSLCFYDDRSNGWRRSQSRAFSRKCNTASSQDSWRCCKNGFVDNTWITYSPSSFEGSCSIPRGTNHCCNWKVGVDGDEECFYSGSVSSRTEVKENGRRCPKG